MKQAQQSLPDIKDDLLKCSNCEYKCKKHVTLMKHLNSKHDIHICDICSLRYNNTKDLKKHFDKDHSDDLNDNDKYKGNKEVEQEKGICIMEDDTRCSKCGYILYTENTTEEHSLPIFYCKICPIINKKQTS